MNSGASSRGRSGAVGDPDISVRGTRVPAGSTAEGT